MFQRNFKVNGEDVNDFMVMQNFAYLKYSSKILEVFLLEKGFSKLKLNAMEITWQKSNEKLIKKSNLMFMQNFTVNLHFDYNQNNDAETKIYILFYNSENTLIAEIQTTINFIDCNSWEFIKMPKQIAKHFSSNEVYLEVG